MPVVVDGPVLLAGAARLLDVGNEGLSTVSQKLFISFFFKWLTSCWTRRNPIQRGNILSSFLLYSWWWLLDRLTWDSGSEFFAILLCQVCPPFVCLNHPYRLRFRGFSCFVSAAFSKLLFPQFSLRILFKDPSILLLHVCNIHQKDLFTSLVKFIPSF